MSRVARMGDSCAGDHSDPLDLFPEEVSPNGASVSAGSSERTCCLETSRAASSAYLGSRLKSFRSLREAGTLRQTRGIIVFEQTGNPSEIGVLRSNLLS